MKSLIANFCRLLAASAIGALVFTACSDDSSTGSGNSGIGRIESGDSLPDCTADNADDTLFVVDSGKVYYCADGEWKTPSSKDGAGGTSENDDNAYKFCDNEAFNPTTDFCYEGEVYEKCGGKSYDVSLKFCSGDTIYPLCGKKSYDPKTEFCGNGSIYELCNGKTYDPKTYTCESGAVVGTAGTITDNRDGQTYKTVKIGTQTWMAENLNYTTDSSYCYNNEDSYCEIYGRLYTWAAAMDSVGEFSKNGKGCGYGVTCITTEPVRGVCPEGWHLPSYEEFDTLISTAGGYAAGKLLKSTSGWNDEDNGTDDYGFSALPAGYRYGNGYFDDAGYIAYFWSATENDEDYARNLYLNSGFEDAILDRNDKGIAFSVRCLKD